MIASPTEAVPARKGAWKAARVWVLAASLAALGACGGGKTVRAPVVEAPFVELAAHSENLPVRVHYPEMGDSQATSQEAPGAHGAGRLALPGIGQIPRDALKLSFDDLRPLVLIADTEPDPGESLPHAELMRIAACGAYVIACADPNDLDSTPFSYFHPDVDATPLPPDQNIDKARELGSKIMAHSIGPYWAQPDAATDQYRGFALVQAAGNDGLSSPFASGFIPEDEGAWRYDPFSKQLFEISSGKSVAELVGVCAGIPGVVELLDCLEADGCDTPECIVEKSFRNVSLIDFRNIRTWVENDWVIYTAGYTLDHEGRPVRHPDSTDCWGVEESCVWVTYSVHLPEGGHSRVSSGTSYGPPRIAMAMAAMLSVYPDLSPPNLVFLTRACAKPVPTLTGNGIADFTCMLNIDESGVISVKDHEDLGLPDVIPPIVLPGELTFTTRLVDRQGRESPFGKRIPSAPMAFRSGLALANPGSTSGPFGEPPPQFELALGNGAGLFGIQESDRRLGTGLVWRRGGLFAAIGHATRDRFFGFAGGGGAWNFRGTREIGANIGHSNLYLRLTSQRTQGRAKLAGKSIGVTAEGEFPLRHDWSLGVRAEADKFLGGRARIPGMDEAAKIRPGDVGYRGEVRLTKRF